MDTDHNTIIDIDFRLYRNITVRIALCGGRFFCKSLNEFNAGGTHQVLCKTVTVIKDVPRRERDRI